MAVTFQDRLPRRPWHQARPPCCKRRVRSRAARAFVSCRPLACSPRRNCLASQLGAEYGKRPPSSLPLTARLERAFAARLDDLPSQCQADRCRRGTVNATDP